jgi:hypothetical protein
VSANVNAETPIVVMVMMVVMMMEIGARDDTIISVVMVVMMMVVMIKILRQLHRLLFGCVGGKAGVVGFKHIQCIRNRFEKVAIAGGGSELNCLRRCGLSGMHGR